MTTTPGPDGGSNRYDPHKCYFCGKLSEWSVFVCDEHLDMPGWKLALTHPVKFWEVGLLHAIGKAPGDDEPPG